MAQGKLGYWAAWYPGLPTPGYCLDHCGQHMHPEEVEKNIQVNTGELSLSGSDSQAAALDHRYPRQPSTPMGSELPTFKN